MRKAVFLTLIAALVLGLGASPVRAQSFPADPDAEQSSFQLVNQERTSRGKPALKWDADLARIARDHSEDMANSGDLYHNDNLPNQVEPGTWNALGENVGYGPDVQQIHDAFMGSTDHRHNILDTYTHIGLGVVVDGDTLWLTQVFEEKRDTSSGSGSSGTTTQHRRPTNPPKPAIVTAPVTTASSAVRQLRAPKARARRPVADGSLGYAMLDWLATEEGISSTPSWFATVAPIPSPTAAWVSV